MSTIANITAVVLHDMNTKREQFIIDYFDGDPLIARISLRLWPYRHILLERPAPPVVDGSTIEIVEHLWFGTRDEARAAGFDVPTEDEAQHEAMMQRASALLEDQQQ